MIIEVARTGGFAGITRRRRIDTALLPQPLRSEFDARLRDAIERGEHGPSPAPHADAFAWEITVDGVRYGIGEQDPAWRELIERVFDAGGLQ